jgi:cytochrome c oxidase cbb3-type subunit 3
MTLIAATGTARRLSGALTLIALIVLAGAGVHWWRTREMEARLLRLPADEIASDASIVAFADERGRSAYTTHCAQCHGADLRGDRRRGIPALSDHVWLYGSGDVSEIETTILYGIRSGHPKARNITDMPAFGRIEQLSPNEIEDVVQYVLSISGQPHEASAATRGDQLYADKGNCFDCHSSDALGNPDYGAPALTGEAWLYGGDRESLRKSVTDGRHGICPAWITQLQPATIRELAIYVYSVAHRNARRTS